VVSAVRIEGWESRLAAVIEGARARPYVLGEHDCFRLACAVIEALTGVDRWPEFAGYRSRRQALAALARHGASFEAAGDWFFGVAHTEVRQARRGDIALLIDDAGEKHLAVVLDHRAACMQPAGLMFVPLRRCAAAWRVG
jgi:hypothetical protein